jgi:hypothetical protein
MTRTASLSTNVDGSGYLTATGALIGAMNVGGDELINTGKEDVLVAKLAYP